MNSISNHIKYVLFFTYILGCLSFFDPTFFDITPKALRYIQTISFVFLYIFLIKNKIKITPYFKGFFLIGVGMLFSIGTASTMHEGQSFTESFFAMLPRFLSYMLFFILLKLQPNIRFTEQIIFFIGLTSALVVIQIWILYPNILFGSFVDSSIRGTRMTANGDTFKICFMFYSLNMLLLKNSSKKYVFFFIICAISVILGIVRQVIVITTALCLMFCFFHISIKKWAFLLIIVTIGFISISKMDFYQRLVELTEIERHEDRGGENIRITATRYYINEAQENLITRIFGNGVPTEQSAYAKKVVQNESKTLCFGSDVGLAYFYHLYGILAILGLISLTWATWKIKIPFRFLYLKYCFAYILLASIASGPIIYVNECIALPFICYMLGKINKEEKIV